jgi:predicted Zn-dependent protease with MMP-like domain
MDEQPTSSATFQQLVDEALASLPQEFQQELKNIAILIADEPTAEQLRVGRVRRHQELFGLYQGVPLPKRGGALIQLPDRIFIFQNPILRMRTDDESIKEQIRSTVFHEIGHYFGMSEEKLRSIQ